MNRLYYFLAGGCLVLGLALGAARAETAVWADNFETNATAHWTANTPWSIGNPTAGPALNAAGYRTHSGDVCASTQKYKGAQDGRLICTSYHGASSLTVPAMNQFPRLRFWQWFSYANALGYVEVSTNAGSSWTQISQTYEYNNYPNGGGVWSRPYLDLSAFSGQHIQIAFHFQSGGSGNGLGWFVDDVEVDTGVPLMTLPEGFEFDPKTTDWSVDAGTWEIGHPTSGPGAAHNGTNCAATVLAGNYSNNVDSRLISPLFTVPPSNSPSLRFWHWYDFNNALGYVEINNGSITVTTVTNTTIVTNITGGTLNTNIYELYGAMITNYNAPFYWNGTIGGWTNATRALGSVYDVQYGEYLFEGGIAPLFEVGNESVEYRSTTNYPSPESTFATNFIVWQGMTWESTSNSLIGDYPIGYFFTNNLTYSYTTNVTVTTGTSSWYLLSSYYEDEASDGWVNDSVDLSAYEGQVVRIAFHFTSGGSGAAPGWYVDDLSLGVAPDLTVPTNQLIYAGDELRVTNSVTNLYVPNAVYSWSLLSPPKGMTISSNGVIDWETATNEPSSTNTITVLVSDDSLPPLTASNSFVVTLINEWIPTLTVEPAAETNYAGDSVSITVAATNAYQPGEGYTFSFLSSAVTNLDISDLAANGVVTWTLSTLQPAGTYTIPITATDVDPPFLSATNHFVLTVLAAPKPVLTVPARQSLNAGGRLDVFFSATNSTFPAATYTYIVTNSPPGVTTNSKPGEVTWNIPATNQNRTVTISVIAVDNHTPPLSVVGGFSVTVEATPRPTLTVPAVVTSYSGQQVAVALSATNTYAPDATYGFNLLMVSTNAFITNVTTASAVYTWTNTGVRNGVLVWTNNSVAPGTNTIYVRVQDNSSWTNSVTNHFSLVFLPPPRPYLVDSATNGAVYVGERTTNELMATNWIVPAATYSYVLLSPLTNGLLQTNELAWTNVLARPGIYPLRLRLTDNSAPPLVDTNYFFMTVFPLPSQLAVAGPSLPAGAASQFRFAITTPWTNLSWRIEAATNVAADDAEWLSVYTNQGSGGSLIFTDRFTTNFPRRYYRAVFP